MAEVFVFPLAQSLVTKLAQHAFQEIGRIWGVESDLKRFKGTLSAIKAVLSDAAQQQVMGEQVRDWLEKLRGVLYDLDDLFDEFTTEKMRQQLERGDGIHKEVINFFSPDNAIKFRREVSNKIEKLRERLDAINEDRKNYQFLERVLCNQGIHKPPRAETHAYVRDADVIGRDGEKNKILRLLLDSKTGHATPGVLPIFGLGGVGKTTLTQLVYNDPEIEGNFDELISMSFFQDVDYDFVDEAVDFKMHDIVHDLALLVAGKEVSHCDSKKEVHPSVRHLLFTEKSVDKDTFPKFLFKLEKVRSFRFKYDMALNGENWLDTLIKSFTFLRSLNLGGSQFEYLPKTIGTLRHLRYLKLNHNRKITKLPNSICDLLNLIYLNLRGCDKLQMLPTNFGKLGRLRYLDLTSKMNFMAKKEEEGLGSLRTFRIYKCEYMAEISKGGLQHLTSLGELSIQGCPKLTSIPQSMKILTSLKIMSIENCKEFDLLEGQGFESLRSLERLYLKKLPSLKKLPLSLRTSPLTLQYLWIEDCPSLKKLEGLGHIKSLLKLRIIKCKQLESLSRSNLQQLESMRYIQIKDCPRLTPKYKKDEGKYWKWISSIPQRSIK